MLQTSFRSVGIALAPAITLNKMYHCVPSISSTMEPTPNPPPTRISATRIIGNNAVAGTEAAICASGWASAASRGRSPMYTPTGTVQQAARTSTNSTRRNVAAAPVRISRTPYSEIVLNSTIMRATANTITAAAAVPHASAVRDPQALACRGRASVWSLAKRSVTASRTGATVTAAANESNLDWRNTSSTGERGVCDASTCSNLNFSLHAIAGRQISWSINTITETIAANPHATARMLPALAAVSKYDPKPGRRKSRLPSVNISHAIKKNHAPATDIMEFHTRPIAEYGNSS